MANKEEMVIDISNSDDEGAVGGADPNEERMEDENQTENENRMEDENQTEEEQDPLQMMRDFIRTDLRELIDMKGVFEIFISDARAYPNVIMDMLGRANNNIVHGMSDVLQQITRHYRKLMEVFETINYVAVLANLRQLDRMDPNSTAYKEKLKTTLAAFKEDKDRVDELNSSCLPSNDNIKEVVIRVNQMFKEFKDFPDRTAFQD